MQRLIVFGSIGLLGVSIILAMVGAFLAETSSGSWIALSAGLALTALGLLSSYFILALRSVKHDLRLVRNRTLEMTNTIPTQSQVQDIATATRSLLTEQKALGQAQLDATSKGRDEAIGELAELLIRLHRQDNQNFREIATKLLEATERTRESIVAELNNATPAGSARDVQAMSDDIVGQIEGLLGLYEMLTPGTALPEFGGFAMAADLAAYVVRTVSKRRPNLVVEAGSGVSTALIGRALQLNGHGTVIALEHDARFVDATQRLIDDLSVADIATVIHCPLKTIELAAGTYRWYDLSTVNFPDPIDILIVDGPPESTGPQARYPALPIMVGYLAPAATVIMDDANREGESKIVDLWMRRHPGFRLETRRDSRGTAVLERTND